MNNKSFNKSYNKSFNKSYNNNNSNNKSYHKSYNKSYNRSYNNNNNNTSNFSSNTYYNTNTNNNNNNSFKNDNNNDPLANWRKKGSRNSRNERWERVGYISRDCNNNKNEDLRQPEIQKQYFKYIQEEIEKIDFSKIEEHTLDPILASLRKLREGIVSSGQKNEFNIEVFELSTRIALKAKNFEELWKSLSYLTLTLYEGEEDVDTTTKKSNKPEYIKYYLLYLICYLPSTNIEKSLIGGSHEFMSRYNLLSEKIKETPEIKFVYELLVLFNVAPINYVRFKELYKRANEYDKILIQVNISNTNQKKKKKNKKKKKEIFNVKNY